MKKMWFAAVSLVVLAACTPAEQQYCERKGTPTSSAEYPNCVQYFFQQTGIFNADRDVCEMQADMTYPRSLYDNGRTAWVHGGYGGDGYYYGGHTIDISPDYAHNAMVDNLRMQIIAPCMQSKGWVNPNTWEAGRYQSPMPNAANSKRAPVVTPKPQPLPWLK